MDKFKDPFLNILPTLDVHGYTEDMVMCVVNEFINDNWHMRKNKICIIHGKGQGILKRKIHESLKRHQKVNRFYLYNFNIGCTIVELKERGN